MFVQGGESSEEDTGKDDMAARTEVVVVVLILMTAKVTVGVTSAMSLALKNTFLTYLFLLSFQQLHLF